MNTIPDPDGSQHDELHEQIERSLRRMAERRERERLAAHVSSGQVNTLVVNEAHFSHITEPTREVVDDLFNRRQELYIARTVVERVIAARGRAEPLRDLSREISQHGGFLEIEGYSAEDLAARIRNKLFVVFRAEGIFTDPRRGWNHHRMPVADVQIEMAPPRKKRTLISYVPDPDVDPQRFTAVNNRERIMDWAREINENPSILGCVQDVATNRIAHRYKFGSGVQQAAISHIAREVNPGRKYPIKYIVAKMFQIKRVSDGSAEYTLEEPLRNKPGILMQEVHGGLGWMDPDTEIVVPLPPSEPDGEPRSATITADWFAAIQQVKP